MWCPAKDVVMVEVLVKEERVQPRQLLSMLADKALPAQLDLDTGAGVSPSCALPEFTQKTLVFQDSWFAMIASIL